MLRCSGAKRFESSTASSSERTRMMALFFSIDFARDGGRGQGRQLALHFLGHGERQALARW